MLCKQANYKSNREVFAKEYVILVEAEQNQALCTYVYISLSMCKELFPLVSDFFDKKYHPSMKKNTKSHFPQRQRVDFFKCRQACWQQEAGCAWFFYFLRIPIFLMFWLPYINPGRSGYCVGLFTLQSHPTEWLWQPFWYSCWRLSDHLVL